MATYKVKFENAEIAIGGRITKVGTFVADIPGDMKLKDNFSFAEFCNKQSGDSIKGVVTARVLVFAEMLQVFRRWYNKPMTVNSWYRTKSFNAKCGGASNSLHLDGLAMDWGVKHTEEQHEHVEEKWRAICETYGEIGGINHYTNGYHLSIGEEKFGNEAFAMRDYRGKKGDW